ncbi:MAG: glucose-6-phosphate isomerase, partial [Lentisphaeria bacterium]|nr:glucose-6-phosphate isomerase [Lentisphaeria bacterium]
IEVMEDAMTANVAGTVTMGDYLHGFMTGLAGALRAKGRQTIEMRIPRVDTFNIGMLIALYERAVAAYAELIHINAFHQPGVQAYKLASKGVIALLNDTEKALPEIAPFNDTIEELAAKLGMEEDLYILEGIMAKLAFNNEKRLLCVKITREWKDSFWNYCIVKK